MLREAPRTLPTEDGVLIINEHGNCNWGKRTAHDGRQWLANIGKTDSGVVSVTSLLMDEKIYWPVGFEPFTPDHHFEGTKGPRRSHQAEDSLRFRGTGRRGWDAL